MLGKVSKSATKYELYFIGVMLMFMSTLAFIQVITRYVFFFSIVWLEEATRYMMVWMTFVGAAVAVEKQDNISIDLIPTLLKGRLKFDFYPILNIAIFIFSCISVYYSSNLVSKTFAVSQQTPAMRIPMAIIYGGMLISYVLMAFHSFVRIIMLAKGKKEEE